MKFLMSLVFILVVTISCNSQKEALSDNKSQDKEHMQQNDLSGTYMISEFGDQDHSEKALTINFDTSTNRVSGFSGCNTFFGQYSIQGDSISFANISSSKKYCPDVNKLEQRFLSTLRTINSYNIKGDDISFSKDNSVLIEAVKKEATSSSKNDIVKDNYKKLIVSHKIEARGMFEYVQISQDGVMVSSDPYLKKKTRYNLEAEDWKMIKEMIENTDVQNLNDLKAPTDKRLFDGAAHATLSIIQGDTEFTTPSFDHGKPPKEIEDLVNKVLSIKESVSKQ